MQKTKSLRGFFILLLVASSLIIINPPEAAAVGEVTYKWHIDDLAETHLAPLAADLDGDGVKEIVLTGVIPGTGGNRVIRSKTVLMFGPPL